MKKILLLLCVLSALIGYAQPSGYTRLNMKYRYRAMIIDSTFHIPKGTTNTLGAGWTGAGALFYNTTDSNLYRWSGWNWAIVGGGAGGGAAWTTTGNTGTVDVTNFIGTTDNIPFNIKVNSQKAGRIDNTLGNTFFGYLSGNAIGNATSNTGVGVQSLLVNTTGVANTALGAYSLLANTIGGSNVAIGSTSLSDNTTGSRNVAIGTNAGKYKPATTSDEIFINSIDRTSYLKDTTESPIWVLQNATVGSQRIRLNGRLRTASLGAETIDTSSFKPLVISTAGDVVPGKHWYSSGGTVTSVATDLTLTGGPITTTGTLKVDTLVMSTRYNRQKGLDSLAALKVSISDTASMLSNYLRGASEDWGIDISGTQHKTWKADSLQVTGWGRLYKVVDSLNDVGWDSTYRASNGLTLSGSDFKLGGTLTENTTIATTASYTLTVSGAVTGSNTAFSAFSTSSGIGVYAGSSSGFGLQASSTTGSAALFSTQGSSGVVTKSIELRKNGTGANGIGSSIDIVLPVTIGSTYTANQIISKFTDATESTRTSQFIITGVNNGSATNDTLVRWSGNGLTRLDKYNLTGSFKIIDTSTYKPIVVDTSGNLYRSTYWSGGGGTPGGSNTQLQYNNSGAFGGISGATSDGTDLFVPTLTGGTSTTADLNLKTTTGVGASGADMHFLVGNNGATEAMTILNSGLVGIRTIAPTANLHIVADSSTVGVDLSGTAKADNPSGAGAAASNIITVVAPAGQSSSSTSSTTSGGVGSGMSITLGAGGAKTATAASSNPGAGGAFTLLGGTGGEYSGGTAGRIAGAGGALTFTSGTGGAQTGTASNVNSKGGAGGALTFTAGAGGAATGSGATQNGGNAGNFTFSGGAGGATSQGVGGQGSNFNLNAGVGGISTKVTGNSGAGGGLFFNGGAGGANSQTSGVAASGGGFVITGGPGGAGSNGASTTTAIGGTIVIGGGAGGANSNSGSVTGAGGDINLTAGDAGAASGGATAGLRGVITIGTTVARTITFGNATDNTPIDITNGTGNVTIGGTSGTARLHLPAGTATANKAPLKLTTGTSNTTAEAGAMEYTTPQLFFTNGGLQRQEIPQIQQTRVSTQYDETDETLGDITGLTATVVAGKNYRFEATLYTTSDVAGGIKVAIGGTATATAIRYEAVTHQGGLTVATGTQRATALGTAVGDITAVTTAYITITGTITVNAAGTLTVQSARNAANGTTSVLTGSTFVLTEML